MYKSRLQEVCHQKHWGLPNYTCTKDGLDHNPRFRASVTVNGASFDSPDFCKSSKEAHNEAARVAFEHFTAPPPSTSPPPPISPSSPILSGPSYARSEVNNNSPENHEVLESSQIHANTSIPIEEMQLSFKSQLQSYTQRRNLNLPLYDHVREGSLHSLHFKATVTVDKQTFESPCFFNTQKEAEHAAARVALLSLSLEGNQEDEPSFYKNLLQELAQKEGFSLPIYRTVRDGPAHMPTFFATVEIEDEVFEGTAGKTKKQAEMYAAKVAWSRLNERRLNRLPASLCMSFQVRDLEHGSSGLQSTATTDLKQTIAPSVPASCTRHEKTKKEIADEDGEDDSSNKTANHSKPSSALSNASQVKQEAYFSGKIVGNDNANSDNAARLLQKPGSEVTENKSETSSSFSSNTVYARSKDPGKIVGNDKVNSDNPARLLRKTESKVTENKRETSSSFSSNTVYARSKDLFPLECTLSEDGTSSPSSQSECSSHPCSLLGNRVRVYPRKPDMLLPKGSTLLPFSDDMWVAVSFLDSSDNEGCLSV